VASIAGEPHRNKQEEARSSWYAFLACLDIEGDLVNLKQLQYFVNVAEFGSFTDASRMLEIAQPALSRQVRALEVELGHTLFRRNGRGVTTTDAGMRLLEHCHGILHQVKRAKEDLGGSHGTLSGQVILGLPPTIADLAAVTLAKRFRARFPDASLSIRVELSAVMREWLAVGRLDVALLYNPVPSSELELSPLAQEPLYLVEPRTAPEAAETVRLEEVSRLPVIVPSRPHGIRMLLESALAAIGRKPNVAWEVDGISTILGLVADGAGYAVLSKQAIATSSRSELYRGRLIVQPTLVSDLYMATAATRAASLTQKAMEEIIRETVADTCTPAAA
jgi:LysR family nitrogen assimilation transcriptional regulator